ncbi:MAG TPA: DUF721 domain-containing protein [Gammaproteobacteria bacterium]|nr:DUF721 domain-containing protein [Gammaproteobacteria bacterium]
MSRSPNRPGPLADALEELLNRQGLDSGLADLAALGRAWRQAAGPRWAGCSRVLGWRGEELVVAVTGPAAASRLRFEADAIGERLRHAGWASVKGIRARVQPHQERAAQPRHRRYSRQAADAAARGAQEVTDPDLRAALQRLAGHLGEPPGGD